jgi:predicted alpha/beta-hydrolase family hydrolase
MAHKSMAAIAEGLAERGIASLRYNFPYMERQSRRVDPPPIAHAAVRAAVVAARVLAGDVPLFAGGRSFGGRMTSQAQAKAPLAGVRGLVFFAFPLHPAGKPGEERAAHLVEVALPMLFLQGTRDALAEPERLARTVAALGPSAEVAWLEEADHSFHVRAASGRTNAGAMAQALDRAAQWMRRH